MSGQAPGAVAASAALTESIVTLYATPMSAKRVALQLGISEPTVLARLRRAGAIVRSSLVAQPLRDGKPPAWNAAEALAMIQAGVAETDVARHYGLDPSAARNMLMFADARQARPAAMRRRCMTCPGTLLSSGKGHRICQRCKDSDAWRSGTVTYGAARPHG